MKKTKTKLWEWQFGDRYLNAFCEKCGAHRTQENPITVDHIIPVSFLEGIGYMVSPYEDEENFQYLCKACNRFKSSKLDHTNPKTKILLRKYLLN